MKEKIKKLVEELKVHIDNYNKGIPTISDSQYDIFYQELKELELKHPDLIQKDSPTQSSIYYYSEHLSKIKHDHPMLSIQNVFNNKEIDTFNKTTNVDEYILEWKLDGIAISLTYDKGILVKALSRGDGLIGENILKNVLNIESLPKTIPYKNKIEFRGEVILTYKDFDKYYSKDYSNPRNTTTGIMKRKTPKKINKCKIVIYSIINPISHNIYKQIDILKFIKGQNIPTNDNLFLGKVSDLKKEIPNFESVYKDQAFPIDGLVIKVNDIKQWDKIGYNSKAPKFFKAYKFKEEGVKTTILDIQHQVGKNTITPVLIIKKVIIDEVEVGRVTAHNYSYIKDNKLDIGGEIEIIRSGKVIPKVHKSYGKTYMLPPSHCPVCNSVLKIKDKDVLCLNNECKGRMKAYLKSSVNKKKLNILNIGDAIIDYLVENEICKNLYDLLTITKEKLLNVPRLGDKNITKILNNIEKCKDNTNINILTACMNIGLIGRRTAEKIRNGEIKKGKAFDSYNKWFNDIVNLEYFNKLERLFKFKNKLLLLKAKNGSINSIWIKAGGEISEDKEKVDYFIGDVEGVNRKAIKINNLDELFLVVQVT